MFKQIHVNSYFMKGKLVEPDMSCFEGKERDAELEAHAKKINELLAQICVNKKPEKKAVYFIVWEGKYYERGELSGQTEFSMVKTDFTPASFKKAAIKAKKEDEKELKNITRMDEPDY